MKKETKAREEFFDSAERLAGMGYTVQAFESCGGDLVDVKISAATATNIIDRDPGGGWVEAAAFALGLIAMHDFKAGLCDLKDHGDDFAGW